jgi:nucleoside-triphosphatase THEP1
MIIRTKVRIIMRMSDLTLPAPDTQGVTILVSGWRRVGKTTLLQRLRQAADAAGLSVGGFLSVAQFVDGEKQGIDLVDAATGARVTLAYYVEDASDAGDAVHTPHYVFNERAFETAVHYAEQGVDADVFFVDELGPLELLRDQGWGEVLPLIRARAHGVTFVVVRPELIDMAREKLQLTPEVPAVEVDEENRELLWQRLAWWIIARATAK